MHKPAKRAQLWLTTTLLGICVTGCKKETTSDEATAAKPITVLASLPVEKEVRDFVDFTGRTDAVSSVQVQARVTGYLVKTYFKEGDDVKKGDKLFEIDPRTYQAQLDTNVAQVAVAQANLELDQADYNRAKEVAKTPGAISPQEVDKYSAQVDVAKAQLDEAKANVEYAKLNVEFCTITSPIDGRTGRYLITVGNLVTENNTELTTIESMDPMYGYFDIDENTLLRIQTLIKEGKIDPAKDAGKIPVVMALANQDDFPIKGTVDFVNNEVDPSTGTLQIRGVFPNPLVNNSRMLIPGMFVRVRVFLGPAYDAVLINNRAVGADQGRQFVYVVNDKNEVEYRQVTLGQQHDNLWAVTSGLKVGEKIVVSGLQRIKPGDKVDTKIIDMPISTDAPLATKIQLPTKSANDGDSKKAGGK